MRILVYLSSYIIPFLFFLVAGYGLAKKLPIYELFIQGASRGLSTVLDIMPTLVGLMVAVGILRASGFLDLLSEVLGSALAFTGFPSELIPLVLVRMFSSSAATSLALDLFKSYGPDSFYGNLASILMSCTETIFYTMSLYFMTAGVKKTRYTLAGALTGMCASLVVSVLLAVRM